MIKRLKYHWPLILLIVLLVSLVWRAQRIYAIQEQEIIVVHTGEAKALHWNPATHIEVRHEMADGSFMTLVTPR